MVVVEIVAAVLLIAAAGVYLLGPVLAWRQVHARRVVVNLKTGRAVSGVLVRRSGDLLFIREAVALEPGADPLTLDGEAVVLRADIDFIQAL